MFLTEFRCEFVFDYFVNCFVKFRYDLKFINRNGFEVTFKLSSAFFIVKDKRSITFGSFEKQASSNISFFAQILPAEEKFKSSCWCSKRF